MNKELKSYRQIFKATSLFGGVQVFHIIVSIIKSKFIAVILGPSGMGIVGLLNSTTNFISALTSFGLGTSAVKNVAAAVSRKDDKRIEVVVTVMRRLVWITGFLGMLITAFLSSWLSELTFGNRDYSLAFIWISITLLIRQLSSGQLVVLQGLRKLNYLAKANVIGSFLGLIVSVPLYYKFKTNGIVPVIISSALISMLLSWFYAKRTQVKSCKIDISKTKAEALDMLKMGFILSISSLIGLGSSYILRVYISNIGGINEVGLYTAGFALINTYVGMIFTAMSTDYYPRLSAVSNDNQRTRELINQQAELSVLILAPVLSIFIIFINPVVIIFYSQKFVPVREMLHWAALGIYFKAGTWSVGTILLAKGASNLFFWNELLGQLYIIALNIFGYKFAGLTGLGISFLLGFVIYFFQIFVIARNKYEFSFKKDFYKIFSFQILLGLLCFLVVKFFHEPYTYIIGAAFILISSIYSFNELEKRVGFKGLLLGFFKKNSSK